MGHTLPIGMVALMVISEPLLSQEIPEHFHPVRPMSMGGAFTAIANDENAVWTNPGGISRIRKHRSRSTVSLVKFPNGIAGVNTSGKDFYTSLKTDPTGAASTVAANSENLESKPFWAMGAAFPMIMFNFGRQAPAVLGGFSHTTFKAVIDEEDPLFAKTEIVSDIGGVMSFGFTNRTNRFNVGFQARSIGRYALEDTIPVAEFLDETELQKRFEETSNRSAALAVDVGMMWTLADFWFPTIGIAMLNAPLGCKTDYLNPFTKLRETVCGTVFQGEFSNPDAISTVDPTDIRAGISIMPRITRKIALRIAVDGHHIHQASGNLNYGFSGIPPLKTVHAGVELHFGNPLKPAPLSVAAGMSQGFYSMGASLRLGFLSVDVATFGRDISSTSVPQEDRRTMGGFSFDF